MAGMTSTVKCMAVPFPVGDIIKIVSNFSTLLSHKVRFFFSMKRFRLQPLKGGKFFTGYNRRVSAQVSTAFAVAGYRFGHSLVQEMFNRFDQDLFEHQCSKCDGKGKSEFLPIAVLDFNNPEYLYDSCKGGVDTIIRGLVKDPAGKADG